ncbi:MAG TPA: GNAT family N-acetyltransferase [Kofleriaceae bacterium]|nr:GNAT family N-acetyltransferase [Kofleriaceae bacterium]
MDVELVAARLSDKHVIRNLLELYEHDMSEYADVDVDEHGLFQYRWLDHYFTEADRSPFLIRVDGKWAGFVFVNQHIVAPPGDHAIAEFFVLRKYRRRGVGVKAAHATLDEFPGRWEIRVMLENVPAQKFWRRVLLDYGVPKPECIEHHPDWAGPIFRCKSRLS